MTVKPLPKSLRTLVLILGDQLDPQSALFEDFDPDQDAVWMAENTREATHVWCHQQRLVFFFSAMRHFARELETREFPIRYHALTPDPEQDRGESFGSILDRDLRELRPRNVVVCEPGDWRVEQEIRQTVEQADLSLKVVPDRHFLASKDHFREWAADKKSLRMEPFYRHMRKTHSILMDPQENPEGGDWNYDSENRDSFGKEGPGDLPRPSHPEPDDLTREVIHLVQQRFGTHPGSLETFHWPVTATGARRSLEDFIEHRLPRFGTYEDAIWTGEPLLYHSRISAALNIKLLNPKDCIQAAEQAYRDGKAPLNSVEGFIRQILGWREFIRGIYWLRMPEYQDLNALECDDRDVPGFFWNGDTDMACAGDAMESVIQTGWSHHIQRLMVLGEFSLLLGVHPYKFHEWHMAMYVDAIDWVSLPNTLGMSQYGDGGIVGTKPYCASGNYIHKMSNACATCRYHPKKAVGENACPFTTLYWDFLDRHRDRFSDNHRMKFQIKNLERKKPEDLKAIRKQATEIRSKLDAGERV